jgi:DNA topoisomerase VI subunit B
MSVKLSQQLTRTAFRTSRLLDFCSRKELVAQTGHPPEAWPLVVLKELVDNALDACEDARTPPSVSVTVDEGGITVADNGPGIPAEVIDGVLDFGVRVSSREAYVAPDRGAQGNALKTVVAMPFVLGADPGRVDVEARGVRHEIAMRTDRIRQCPAIERNRVDVGASPGTKVRLYWPDSSTILRDLGSRFLQLAGDYTVLNPHLTLDLNWFGESSRTGASDPGWKKWLPGNPTCPHWYGAEHMERLVAAYIAHDEDAGRARTVRELVKEFHGLIATAKQKTVLDECGLSRVPLAGLARDGAIDAEAVGRLLDAMKRHGKAVKPLALGPIGKPHLSAWFEAPGCEMKTFKYTRPIGETDGVPWVVETAFGWCPSLPGRRLVTGVNWSPGIVNPFRELGKFGRSLDSVLERQRAGKDEPVCLLLHMVCPRVEYTDRGKSAVVVAG